MPSAWVSRLGVGSGPGQRALGDRDRRRTAVKHAASHEDHVLIDRSRSRVEMVIRFYPSKADQVT